VIDVSVSGVLLASARTASVGTRGRLSLTLGGSPLAAEVEIRRVLDSPDRTGFRMKCNLVEPRSVHHQRLLNAHG